MDITLDEGFQFGLGLFETICVEQGKPLLLSWHLERLYASMKALDIFQPVTEKEVMVYLKMQPGEHRALKIMVSEKNRLFTIRPNPYTPEKISQGFLLDYSQVYRNETSPLVRHKTMNYGDCILEKRHAALRGVDELIFCNSRGEICEGTTTNIFFVQGKQIYTPPVSCGLLPGITRRFIMEYFPVTEKILYPEDVMEMEECFVTNSLMGVMPVRRLGDKEFQKRNLTEICRKHFHAFSYL